MDKTNSQKIIERGLERYQYIADGGIGYMDLEMLGWMKKANFKSLQFGMEFGSQRVLDAANKKIKVEDAIESVSTYNEELMKWIKIQPPFIFHWPAPCLIVRRTLQKAPGREHHFPFPLRKDPS